MSDRSPGPGWYPDPGNPQQLRYWDGAAWTVHTHPVAPATPSPWGAPAPQPTQVFAAEYGAAAAYAPPQRVLTPSGMRPVAALFTDAGRILKRAWWQIVVVSVALWALWAFVLAALTAVLVDAAALRRAIDLLPELTGSTRWADLPEATRAEVEAAFRAAFQIETPRAWIAVGVLALLFTILVGAAHLAALNRLAIDAASGAPVSLGRAWRAIPSGGVRLFGYGVLLMLVFGAISAVLVTLIVLTSPVPGLAALIGVVGYLALVVAGVLVFTRLVPVPAQAVVARGALGWSWRATKGKFFAVLGRYLLWSIVASLVVNIVLSIVFFGVGLVFSAGLTSTDPWTALAWGIVFGLVTLPLSLALSAFTYIGVVPIWRDLTEDPAYRSIGPDGVPVVTAN